MVPLASWSCSTRASSSFPQALQLSTAAAAGGATQALAGCRPRCQLNCSSWQCMQNTVLAYLHWQQQPPRQRQMSAKAIETRHWLLHQSFASIDRRHHRRKTESIKVVTASMKQSVHGFRLNRLGSLASGLQARAAVWDRLLLHERRPLPPLEESQVARRSFGKLASAGST